MTAPARPPAPLRTLVETALGKTSTSWQRPHTGLSAAHRFVVTFADGSSVFVKQAVDAETEEWLRTERRVIETITGPYVPRIVAWVEGDHPALLTEDLSAAYWPADQEPVRWEPGQIPRLLATLQSLAATPAPDWLPAAEPTLRSAWRRIERSPEAFLSLGLCSPDWLARALPRLAAAEEGLDWNGACLVHNDVRSDNLCFQGERLILVDWGSARRGPPGLDLAGAVSTLPLEGGPAPNTLMPNAGGWASYRAAIAAIRAGSDRTAPAWLRVVLARIAAITLDWSVAALSLPARAGRAWTEIT